MHIDCSLKHWFHIICILVLLPFSSHGLSNEISTADVYLSVEPNPSEIICDALIPECGWYPDPFFPNPGECAIIYSPTPTLTSYSYSLSESNYSGLSIDANTGDVTLCSDELLFELYSHLSFTIIATDVAGNTRPSFSVTISVPYFDTTPPNISSGHIVYVDDDEFNFDGSFSKQIYTAAVNNESEPVYYSLTSQFPDIFSIDSYNGIVTFNYDHTQHQYLISSAVSFTLIATDSSGNASSKEVQVYIGPQLCLAVLPPPITIYEHDGINQVVYTANYNGPAGNITYSLTPSSSPELSINSITGVVTLAEIPEGDDYLYFGILLTDANGFTWSTDYCGTLYPWIEFIHSPPVSVTFQVDMTGVDLQGQVPTVNGTFNSWCGDCAPMTDEDGDNVWTLAIDLEDGAYDYKFALGAWVDQESVPEACGVSFTLEDGTPVVNRNVVVSGGNITLDTAPWSGCPAGTVVEPEPVYTVEDGFQFVEAFGGATIDGSVFTFPASAEDWAGFVNLNTAFYPITIAEDGVITFTGSVPAGGDAVVRFRFEANPYPNTEPSFYTGTVTVSGAAEASYSIFVPSQGTNKFNSFVMYVDTRDVGVSVADIAINTTSVGSYDFDNDGVNNAEDTFPNDPSESVDTDNDGVGDNADAFPSDASESVDTDGDGIGNNADTDDDGDGVADAVDGDPLDPSVGELPQQLITVKGDPSASIGGSVNVVIEYDTSNNDATLTGLSLSVHYDSSSLTFTSFADVLATDNIYSNGPFNDDQDLDGNPATDKYVSGVWASLFGSWPGQLPAELLRLSFDVVDSVTSESTPIGFSSVSNISGYIFAPTPYDMPFSSGSWDFDKDGKADALTDGLMLLRYTFNLRDTAVTAGAISADSPLTPAEVEANIAEAISWFADIDNDGRVDALTDGLMFLRYLFKLRGDALIAGAIAGGAERSTSADVEAYIISLMP